MLTAPEKVFFASGENKKWGLCSSLAGTWSLSIPQIRT